MDVLFEDEKFRDLVGDFKGLSREYGALQARKVQQRIKELRSAETLADMRLMPGRAHELKADLAGTFAVDLVQPSRLLFEPAEYKELNGGGIDWASVTGIVVIRIEADYH